jgi:hypothetical protein
MLSLAAKKADIALNLRPAAKTRKIASKMHLQKKARQTLLLKQSRQRKALKHIWYGNKNSPGHPGLFLFLVLQTFRTLPGVVAVTDTASFAI